MNTPIISYHHNPMQCNQYLVIDGDQALMIDASTPPDDAMMIALKNVKNLLMVYTHSHFDHIAYGHQLRHSFEQKGIKVESKASIFEKEMYGANGLASFQHHLEYFDVTKLYANAAPPTIDIFIEHDGAIGFGDFIFEHSPGHSVGSAIIYSPSQKVIFTGDTLFTGGAFGRVDLPGGSYRELRQSLIKIFAMDGAYTIYPGHGDSGPLEKEKKIF